MKPRLHLVLVAVVACALAAVLFDVLPPREPVYQSRPLSVWLEDLQKGRDGLQHEQAVAAIQAIGTNALPLIAERLFYEDSALRRGLHQRLTRWRLERFVPLRQPDYAEQALFAVQSLGPVAAPLVPEATRQLDDPAHLRDPVHLRIAARTLGSIGDESARRALVQACASTNRLARFFTADALNYGPPMNLVHGTFLKLLLDFDPTIRAVALRSLSRTQVHKGAAAELLAGFAQDAGNGGERSTAIYALGVMGPVTTNVVPMLKRLMDDPDGKVANAAADALNRINLDPKFRPIMHEVK